ncbi:MAG: hypothetical protein HLUCCO17_12115 [Saliniramus fredricksonii]|uniref:Uncharacterized protein n=1 Tax=Saliniramus fredricksonii TaxID=1653334 RepID=A0A0P7X5M5_9HYPH|nr:MAG: hypothetical protein HLUCCO17_12115 [Saliniramus fredricksonii]
MKAAPGLPSPRRRGAGGEGVSEWSPGVMKRAAAIDVEE